MTAYRTLLADRRTRRLLTGLGVSSLGDGISTVTIAWLAIRVAPADQVGLLVGLAVAAYTLPGVIGALAFASLLRGLTIVSTPLGTAIGGPIVESIGAAETLTASGIATVVLAAAASILWPRENDGAIEDGAFMEPSGRNR